MHTARHDAAVQVDKMLHRLNVKQNTCVAVLIVRLIRSVRRAILRVRFTSRQVTQAKQLPRTLVDDAANNDGWNQTRHAD